MQEGGFSLNRSSRHGWSRVASVCALAAAFVLVSAVPAYAVAGSPILRKPPASLRPPTGSAPNLASIIDDQPIINDSDPTGLQGTMSGTLNPTTNPADVGYLWLNAGETVQVTVDNQAYGSQLYDDATTDWGDSDVEPGSQYLVSVNSGTLTYDVPTTGFYDLRVFTSGASGPYTATVLVTRPATFILLDKGSVTAAFDADAEMDGFAANGRDPSGASDQPAGTVTLSYSPDGMTFFPWAVESLDSDGSFGFTLPNIIEAKTWWSASYGGASDFVPSMAVMVVNTYAKLTNPTATRKGTKTYRLAGDLTPEHKPGTAAVRLYLERLIGGKWKASGSVTAKVSDLNVDSGTISAYAVTYKFSATGKWRVRAYHGDADHLPTYSGWTSVTVK